MLLPRRRVAPHLGRQRNWHGPHAAILSWLALGVVLTVACGRQATAGGGPQNLILVVNPDDPDSLTVANHYVDLRQAPSTNVIHIPWKRNAQRASGKAFRDKLLLPVLREIDRRELSQQIDLIAFSCGFPYLIDFSGEFPRDSLPPYSRPAMSLNGAAYLYQLVLAQRKEAFGLYSNFYAVEPLDGRTPTRAFRGTRTWAPGGRSEAAGSLRYLLSTSLGVTYGRGNRVDEIIDYLRRAKAADGTRPDGTIYYMRNDNVRSKVRRDSFASAVAELGRMGVKAAILDGRVPRNRQDIAGLTAGSTNVDVRAAGGRFLPGALVDNLTSAGGQFQIPKNPRPQTPISQYLREGAAGASGTVVEPLAIPAKFPSAELYVHYARGCSLAEAYYQSVRAPFQLLILGDPLCQPWARIPSVEVQGAAENSLVSGVLELLPAASTPDNVGIQRFEAYVDGALRGGCKPGDKISIDTNDLSDGWHAVRVVAIDATPVAVQGAWVAAVIVKNGRDAIQMSSPDAERAIFGRKLRVAVTSTGSGKTVVSHLGREVGLLPDGSGEIEIETAKLGRGPVLLEARQDAAIAIQARPLRIEVR